MNILFDTVNIESIKKYKEIVPFIGVTSNPTIIKAEGRIDFFEHFKAIRNIIGSERSLHVQVVSTDSASILKEAELIAKKIDSDVYIKVPVTEEGLKAIKILKANGVNVTATAVYSSMQGILAVLAGADFVAPYVNRMENIGVNPGEVIRQIAAVISSSNSKCRILAASFKNAAQVCESVMAGSHTVTLQTVLLEGLLRSPAAERAVEDFSADFKQVFNCDTILKL
ncbi:MAG: fructose-6-phosphate aldolase [Oscillospiraceae bacterium]